MKKILCTFLICIFVFSMSICTLSEENNSETKSPLNVTARSAVLMEATTGAILYSYDADIELPPASVTKIMTLILIMEAIDNGTITIEDTVTASEHACSMGGTQIYLEVGEQMSVNDLIKSIVVPSANDAAVAMAEYVAGSEPEFVSRMNQKAADLGMNHTNFTNCTGLIDDEQHYTTANDIAIMTRELLKHPKIFDYTGIWMDTIRNGDFTLANTNKLLRTYSGLNGMKTGYTKKSLYCYSGTAERNGMTLIATVMGCPTSPERFKDAASMLDYGFANYSVITREPEKQPDILVKKGVCQRVKTEVEGNLSLLLKKGEEKLITTEVHVDESVNAPVAKGTEVGTVVYKLDGEIIKECKIITADNVDKAGLKFYWNILIHKIFG